MKKVLEYNVHVKTLAEVVFTLKEMNPLPEEVKEKTNEFIKYLEDYIYGDFYNDLENYSVDEIIHQEVVTYSNKEE